MRVSFQHLVSRHQIKSRISSALLVEQHCLFHHDSRKNEKSTTTSTSTPSSLPPSSLYQYLQTPDGILKETMKGVGQVLFLNDQRAGILLTGSLFLHNPLLASMAVVGAGTSNLVAHSLQLSTENRKQGLYAYNGSLIGCATVGLASSVLSSPASLPLIVTSTLFGAASTTVLSAALPVALGPRMPQWTFAFNIAIVTMMLQNLPNKVEVLFETTSPASSTVQPSALEILTTTPWKGLSQIFVVESTLSGMGIAVALASVSPQLALHALLGSTVGSLTAVLSSSSMSAVGAGLYGYNSALTSLGVGVFFRNTRESWGLSVAGAWATALVTGAMAEGLLPVPCMTLPFCITMSGCYLLGKHQGMQALIPGLELAKNPHSPEQNL